MKLEIRDRIVALLAAEMEAHGDNLDDLEGAILESLRQIGQGTLRAVAEAKKGATQAAAIPAAVAKKRGSSATGPRRSSR